jgi:dnd system-associated protein 4
MDRRIRMPKDKGDLIDRLVRSEEYPNGPFRLRADVISFAAMYGFRRKRKVEFSNSLEPIRQDVFEKSGQDQLINLLALAETKDPHSLAQTEEAVKQRITIFEEYANGGLELLRQELHGHDDPLDRLLLLIEQERGSGVREQQDEYDLSEFLR